VKKNLFSDNRIKYTQGGEGWRERKRDFLPLLRKWEQRLKMVVPNSLVL
jgi:hypothetical protein